jgi:hypothetical protein
MFKRRDDPYCAFKNDRERRIALVARSRWTAVTAACTAVAASIAARPEHWKETVQWLISLFH